MEDNTDTDTDTDTNTDSDTDTYPNTNTGTDTNTNTITDTDTDTDTDADTNTDTITNTDGGGWVCVKFSFRRVFPKERHMTLDIFRFMVFFSPNVKILASTLLYPPHSGQAQF